MLLRLFRLTFISLCNKNKRKWLLPCFGRRLNHHRISRQQNRLNVVVEAPQANISESLTKASTAPGIVTEAWWPGSMRVSPVARSAFASAAAGARPEPFSAMMSEEEAGLTNAKTSPARFTHKSLTWTRSEARTKTRLMQRLRLIKRKLMKKINQRAHPQPAMSA